jgi:hypothetical protein
MFYTIDFLKRKSMEMVEKNKCKIISKTPTVALATTIFSIIDISMIVFVYLLLIFYSQW